MKLKWHPGQDNCRQQYFVYSQINFFRLKKTNIKILKKINIKLIPGPCQSDSKLKLLFC